MSADWKYKAEKMHVMHHLTDGERVKPRKEKLSTFLLCNYFKSTGISLFAQNGRDRMY